MKKIARLLFVPVLLMVVFSLMPTGSSTDEVLAGYQSTTSFSASGSSYLLYMMQFRLAKIQTTMQSLHQVLVKAFQRWQWIFASS